MAELILFVLLGGIVFWIIMLTDWCLHEPEGNDRIIWLLIIVLMNVVGAFAYLCLRYRFNRNKIKVPVIITTFKNSEKPVHNEIGTIWTEK